MNGEYNGKGIEFSNYIENLRLHEGIFRDNYFIDSHFKYDNESVNVFLLSKGFPGKTCLLHRLIGSDYLKDPIATICIDSKIMNFDFNHMRYNIEIWDTSGIERFRSVVFLFLKNVNIAIYLINLANMEEGIDINFIENQKFLKKL